MPLVTRNVQQANLFKLATEPTNWQDGDLWSDTTANLLKLNVGGTAVGVAVSMLDALRADHTIAGSIGQFFQEMMDQAIQSDNTAESGLDVTRRISAEDMGTVTAESLMAKLTGMTDDQAVATAGGPTITFDNERITLTASQSDATTPASGETDSGVVVAESTIAGSDLFEISADSGSNFAAMTVVGANAIDISVVNRTISYNGIGNSAGRYRILASSDTGNRTYSKVTTTVA